MFKVWILGCSLAVLHAFVTEQICLNRSLSLDARSACWKLSLHCSAFSCRGRRGESSFQGALQGQGLRSFLSGFRGEGLNLGYGCTALPAGHPTSVQAVVEAPAQGSADTTKIKIPGRAPS